VLKKVSAQKLLEQAEVSRGLTPAGEDGLRPASRCLWEHIRRLHADHGVTVFLTTHYLDEVDTLCDGTLVIDDGEIVAERSPDSLTARVSDDGVTIGWPAEFVAVAKIAGKLAGAPKSRPVEDTVGFQVPRGDADQGVAQSADFR
jgi:ABC-2 type transport system ATP-binding protein